MAVFFSSEVRYLYLINLINLNTRYGQQPALLKLCNNNNIIIDSGRIKAGILQTSCLRQEIWESSLIK